MVGIRSSGRRPDYESRRWGRRWTCCGSDSLERRAIRRPRWVASMSAIGGVGINLAIQDAVAAANILAAPLRDGRPTLDQLRRVQKRRELPTRITQWLQVTIQRRLITPVLAGARPLKPPLAVRLLARFPLLRRLPPRPRVARAPPEP